MAHFGTKRRRMVVALDLLYGFFLILPNQKGRKVNPNYFKDLSEKKSIRGNWTILDQKMTPIFTSGSAQTIVLKLCTLKWVHT